MRIRTGDTHWIQASCEAGPFPLPYEAAAGPVAPESVTRVPGICGQDSSVTLTTISRCTDRSRKCFKCSRHSLKLLSGRLPKSLTPLSPTGTARKWSNSTPARVTSAMFETILVLLPQGAKTTRNGSMCFPAMRCRMGVTTEFSPLLAMRGQHGLLLIISLANG